MYPVCETKEPQTWVEHQIISDSSRWWITFKTLASIRQLWPTRPTNPCGVRVFHFFGQLFKDPLLSHMEKRQIWAGSVNSDFWSSFPEASRCQVWVCTILSQSTEITSWVKVMWGNLLHCDTEFALETLLLCLNLLSWLQLMIVVDSECTNWN